MKPDSTEESVPKTSLLKKVFVVLFLLLCGAGAIAISQLLLSSNSIRLDEAQSLWQTSHSLPGTLKVVAQDVHVPLYHVLLHFWQIFVGQSVESARLMSLGFFIATIPVVYLLARRVLSVNWSLFATFLFSFSPFMNWYANEARMYTLLAFVVALSQYFFIRIIESGGKKGWIGYALTAMVGVYAHYFFVFNLLTQGMYFLFNRQKFAKGTIKKFIVLAIVLLIEVTPWIIYFISLGAASNTSPNLPTPSSVDFSNVYSQFIFGFQNNTINTVLVSSWPILVLVTLLSVKKGQKLGIKMGYIIVAVFVPIILAFVLSYLLSPFFLSRYMIASLAPLMILITWFISNYRTRLAIPISILVVMLLAAVSYQQYTSPSTPVKEDYKAASDLITDEANPTDIVVLSAPFTVYPFQYYYNGTAKVTTLPQWDRTIAAPIPAFDESKLPGQVGQINKSHQYVYLLLSYDQGYEDKVFQYYESQFEKIMSKEFSEDLNLHVYRVGYKEIKPLEEVIQ